MLWQKFDNSPRNRVGSTQIVTKLTLDSNVRPPTIEITQFALILYIIITVLCLDIHIKMTLSLHEQCIRGTEVSYELI